ncbi:Protein-disulfide isomerase [Paramicrobacterium humi]|uniref:Protein-disulfide isomerase n=1 Tax=Paramicrobacterium humi TaxID=640635 RepID=A0A1H4K019_9MICO|nr:thioredoxin domain-containing protein [Microbacterium humi]SEB51222.1 Protein-disulfide isomerase [Microbacterium humi]
MSPKPSSPSPAGGSKNQRKQRIREIAKQERERQERHQRRVRWAWQGGIAAVVVAAVVVIVLIIVTSSKPTETTAGPQNMLSDGVLIAGDSGQPSVVTTPALKAGDDPVATDVSKYPDAVHVAVYLDYMCPYCGQFETANGDQLTQMAAQGTITLEVHPISFLDRLSNGTKYSTRAANAAACVANYEPDSFLAVNSAFFMNQPEENTSGLSDDELWTLIQGAGVTNEKVKSCIDNGTFSSWVSQATDRAMKQDLPNMATPAPLSGTPTVLIDGELYGGSITDPAALSSAIQQAYESAGQSPEPTATSTK